MHHAAHLCDGKAHSTFAAKGEALVVMAEVTTLHHFIEDKQPNLLVGFYQQVTVFELEEFLQYVHQTAGELHHTEPLQEPCIMVTFFFRESPLQQIVIVHQLADSDALMEDVLHHMTHLEYPVEAVGWDMDGSRIIR